MKYKTPPVQSHRRGFFVYFAEDKSRNKASPAGEVGRRKANRRG